MNNFQAQLTFFENNTESFEKVNLSFSEGSVGWHIAHSCLVITSIINVLSASNPAEYTSKFNWKKSIIFFTNKIPRGKGKAPERVKPRESPTKDSLLLQINEAKQKIELLNNINANAYFEHPYFGKLNLKETQKFLHIHNNHHSKIIKDIIK